MKVLRVHKQELEARYGITRLGIFGSVARDEAADESDVDVVVEMMLDLFGRVRLKEYISNTSAKGPFIPSCYAPGDA